MLMTVIAMDSRTYAGRGVDAASQLSATDHRASQLPHA
jgi:hypothetical protein